ncbi:unnamed protein product [Adineta steineri]|uniref:Uncharacterized protein n=1 Tax=Adineta steineri TaxID=433720 RepID=A0A814BVC3_9BILA|nr:unnamed protein product [Adineta steineri]
MKFFHLAIVTSLVCGLEFCTASAFTYIPPILFKAGISELSMTWIMGCGNLIEAPTIGLSLLVISCILFYFAAQACFNPCESLIYDIYKGTSQESSCFFVYSFMTSFGYLITATDWTESYLSNYMQGQEKLTFYVILLFFSITLCCTLISANEKVPVINDNLDEQSLFNNIHICHFLFPIKFLKILITMPFVLRRLTLAECCSWSVIMIFNLLFTDFVDQTVYIGDPSADELSEERLRYDQGV